MWVHSSHAGRCSAQLQPTSNPASLSPSLPPPPSIRSPPHATRRLVDTADDVVGATSDGGSSGALTITARSWHCWSYPWLSAHQRRPRLARSLSTQYSGRWWRGFVWNSYPLAPILIDGLSHWRSGGRSVGSEKSGLQKPRLGLVAL